MERLFSNRWNYFEKTKIYYHNKGYFMMKFSTTTDKNQVLYAGPQMLNNRPISIKAWTPDFDFANKVCKTIPLYADKCTN